MFICPITHDINTVGPAQTPAYVPFMTKVYDAAEEGVPLKLPASEAAASVASVDGASSDRPTVVLTAALRAEAVASARNLMKDAQNAGVLGIVATGWGSVSEE
ncbi:hypothetical protein Q5752_000499 [Cryptotrichosporon argae]